MSKNSQSVERKERKAKKEEVEDEVPLFSLEAQRQHTAQAAKRPAPPAPVSPSSSSKPLAATEEKADKAIKPKMSEKEAIAEARPKVSVVLKEVREHMETCVAQARATLDSLRRDERPTDRGVSFLEVSRRTSRAILRRSVFPLVGYERDRALYMYIVWSSALRLHTDEG
jgi:hypothetical protein